MQKESKTKRLEYIWVIDTNNVFGVHRHVSNCPPRPVSLAQLRFTVSSLLSGNGTTDGIYLRWKLKKMLAGLSSVSYMRKGLQPAIMLIMWLTSHKVDSKMSSESAVWDILL